MIELKRNYDREGIRSRDSAWQCYSAWIGKIGVVHIHNNTKSGGWIYEIITTREQISKSEYEDKDIAFMAALGSFAKMVILAKAELADALGVDLQ